MTRVIPLSIAAGALALALAAGSAQAAPATGGILGKLNVQSQSQVEKAGWRGNRRCFRRCMRRSGGAYGFCRRRCHRWWR